MWGGGGTLYFKTKNAFCELTHIVIFHVILHTVTVRVGGWSCVCSDSVIWISVSSNGFQSKIHCLFLQWDANSLSRSQTVYGDYVFLIQCHLMSRNEVYTLSECTCIVHGIWLITVHYGPFSLWIGLCRCDSISFIAFSGCFTVCLRTNVTSMCVSARFVGGLSPSLCRCLKYRIVSLFIFIVHEQ